MSTDLSKNWRKFVLSEPFSCGDIVAADQSERISVNFAIQTRNTSRDIYENALQNRIKSSKSASARK
ncbi:MAG: hypothetical protein ACR2PF_10025 [Rhizobiaceae bacterium]